MLNPVLDRISNIKTGFWLKIPIELQRLIHEINDFNVIDVIQIHNTDIY
nr:MAG TPA: hypothetical protein [Caudoviricetes sp.]